MGTERVAVLIRQWHEPLRLWARDRAGQADDEKRRAARRAASKRTDQQR